MSSPPSAVPSVQKLLDENAQLIRALVENMSIKGKAMECIQYQQSLHKNLVYLASLADPSLNMQTALPPPGSKQRPPPSQAQGGQHTASSTSTTASQSTAAGGGVPGHMTTSSMIQRQPQAPSSNTGAPGSSEVQGISPAGGQFGGAGGGNKGYGGGSMWSGRGQADPYAMQRPPMGAMGGGGGYQMGMSPDQLRMRQEQMIAAQQARRMQQSVGGAMYPPRGGGPPLPPGMMPQGHQPGMPPSYPQNPHSIPPGTRPMRP